MSILSKNTIIKEVLPHLTLSNYGRQLTDSKLVSIVQAIFYRLKTGCQWRELPIKQFFEESYSWNSVFHHFSQWSKKGAWQKAWEALLAAHKDYLDMSSIQIDGTHTPARGGGQAVG